MAGKKYKPVSSAKELLKRYAAGQRNFDCAVLRGANICGADLTNAYLSDADLHGAILSNARLVNAILVHADLGDVDFRHADLSGAILSDADLSDANLSGANLRDTNFGGASLHNANLSGTNLSGARLSKADLSGACLGGAKLGWNTLMDLDLSPLCDVAPSTEHDGPSDVDFRSVINSLQSPHLKDFLQRTGMPEIFAEYMVECARAMDGSLIKKLLQSTFISYGGPDEPFARRLYEGLHRNGVTTFFFPEHAKPGQRIGRVVRENVESYDRILLLCSQASLDRKGVLYEIEETLERERRDGGAEYLIPVELDDCLRVEGAVLRKDLVRVLRDRVCADFRGAQEDESVFQAGLRKLIAALRPPDVAVWRPPGSKPTDP